MEVVQNRLPEDFVESSQIALANIIPQPEVLEAIVQEEVNPDVSDDSLRLMADVMGSPEGGEGSQGPQGPQGPHGAGRSRSRKRSASKRTRRKAKQPSKKLKRKSRRYVRRRRSTRRKN